MKKILLSLLLTSFIFSVNAFDNKKDNRKKGKNVNPKAVAGTQKFDADEIHGYNITNGNQRWFYTGFYVSISFAPQKSITVEDSTLNYKYEYEYEPNLVIETQSTVENGVSSPVWRNYFYHSGDMVRFDSMIYEDYDTIANTFVYSSKWINTYNEFNQITQYYGYEFDTLTNSWKNMTKMIAQFDGNNRVNIEDFWYWPPNDTNWTYSTQTNYTYENDLVKQMEDFFWDPGSNTLKGYFKSLFNYDSQGNIIENVDSTKFNMETEYSPDYLEKNFYTGANIDSSFVYYWDDTNLTWISDWIQLFNYDDENRLISEDEYALLPDNSGTKSANGEAMFEKIYTWVYKYEQAVSNEILFRNNSISIYPNPAAETVNIRIQNPNNCRLHVFNIQGKLMLNQKINSSVTSIPTQNFKSGAYIFRITNNGKTTSQTIIKQ